jgi:hypothetical protein
MDGAGLNITVMSYRGVLNWGLISCAETVPRLADLAIYIPDALDELARAAGVGATSPVGVAPGRPRPREIAESTERAPQPTR